MSATELLHHDLTNSVIGSFYDVYNVLGFGFLESVYLLALERELVTKGHSVARQVVVVVNYKGVELARQRIDMVVDDQLVVEAKSTYLLPKAAGRQVYNYLRASDLEVGLLLHFGPEPRFFRFVSQYKPGRSAQSA